MNGEIELLQAVQREPVVKHVHRELRRAILQGRFAVESRLVETAIAKLLNVSRTPVREAISKLELEGLVRRLPGGGVVVEDTSSKLSEVIVLRQSLEGAAARLICMRASDGELAALRAECDAVLKALPTMAVQQRASLDRKFHLNLGELSGSTRLANLIEEFYEYSDSELAPAGNASDVVQLQKQHIAIVDALVARDAARAETAIRDHLETVLHMVRARVHA
ncbi:MULTISPECIES: GntR family transcriptional regulator [unclassified Chelatococcus]|uniref:GntR family transcriptional regulator n=1 Tax=unclassified Chelatococcus TaxID=2638111 RepID=UPI001BD00631|nr:MULTISPECIES: GntR family transcriptional regulator [unclassified Chelatococcus]MBS7701188.1 GntR family transcriptional regulator [Chelatococcus sp. YT9]MBX3557319.1 GntR family transcriptional regulator [Chelatococcus sp.]